MRLRSSAGSTPLSITSIRFRNDSTLDLTSIAGRTTSSGTVSDEPSPIRQEERSLKRSILFAQLVLLLAGTANAASSGITRGRSLYLQYCASCHGRSGEGDGPVARSLTTPPANLRRLSERLGNPLPVDQVARYIDGREAVKAHGPRDMPVWVRRFYYESDHDERQARKRIADLVTFLQSIQTPIRDASSR